MKLYTIIKTIMFSFSSLLCVLALIPLCYGQFSSFGLSPSSFGLSRYVSDPCENECQCNDTTDDSAVGANQQRRFMVNCTGMKFGINEGMHIPQGLPSSTTDLIVSEYLLGTVNMGSFNFPQNPLLLSLTLENCHITYLSSNTFQSNSLVSLRNITIARNNFDLLAEGAFKHLPYIENISIGNNFIQKVQREAFWNLPLVHIINISHNFIKEIQPGTFENLPHLEILDLSHNWLETISGEDIAQLTSLKVLNLNGNFWNCSCKMIWILNFTSTLVDSGEAVCLSPATLNGTALQELTAKDFQHCFYSDSPLTGTGIAVVTVIAILFSIIYILLHSGESDTKIVGQLLIHMNQILGSKLKRNVFKGELLNDGRVVAVKRYPQLSKPKELEILLSIYGSHQPNPNVIQYLCVESDSLYTYIALEFCGGNLKTAISDCKEELFPFLTRECCLQQISSGIKFLHDLKIKHRDLKPQNVLWNFIHHSSEVRFIISDFDISRFVEDETSGKPMRGTEGWSAPELWNKKEGVERTVAVDVFSLGCIFFYVLTRGKHPFGSISDMEECQLNIDTGKSSLDDLKEYYDGFVVALAEDIIEQMINSTVSKRPHAGDILKHPLFWDSGKMENFYRLMGDYMKKIQEQHKEALESNATSVIGENWKDRLDKIVKSDVKSYKDTDKICPLLTIVRNKIVHLQELGKPSRDLYLEKGGVVQYYNSCFPKLLIHSYRAEQKWKMLGSYQ